MDTTVLAPEDFRVLTGASCNDVVDSVYAVDSRHAGKELRLPLRVLPRCLAPALEQFVVEI